MSEENDRSKLPTHLGPIGVPFGGVNITKKWAVLVTDDPAAEYGVIYAYAKNKEAALSVAADADDQFFFVTIGEVYNPTVH